MHRKMQGIWQRQHTQWRHSFSYEMHNNNPKAAYQAVCEKDISICRDVGLDIPMLVLFRICRSKGKLLAFTCVFLARLATV